MQAHLRTLEISRHQNLSLFGRLAFGSRQQRISSSTIPTGSITPPTTRLASQLQEVRFDSNPTSRTPRLCIGYQEDDSCSPVEETARYQTVDKASSRQTKPSVSSSDSQLDNAHTGSHVCGFSSSTIHSTSTVLQEPDSQDGYRLGHSSSLGSSEPTGTIMVVPQPQEMERSLNPPNHANTNHLFCRCQQHGLGLQLEPTSSPWLLDPIRGRTINQLARTQSCLSGASDLSPSRTLHRLDSDGQHYQSVIQHQQARRDSLSGVIGPSNRSLELVSPTQDSDSGTTHQRSEQQDSRYGIPQKLLQESVDDQALSLPTHFTPLGTLLSRPIRLQDNQTVTKVRVLATRSGRYPYGCVYHPMDQLDETVCESPMESDFSCSTQDCAGETSINLPGSSLLAERHIVPSGTTSGSLPTFDAITTNDSNDVSQNASSPSSSELDTLLLAIIHNKL
ncbi:hypothetical protein PS6_011638, partial [Mucor atramentarius]